MNVADLIVFGLGVSAGAVAVYLPWLHPMFKKYVLNCGKANCPHHGADNTKRMNDINDKTRNGPTRPDIH